MSADPLGFIRDWGKLVWVGYRPYIITGLICFAVGAVFF
jgi:hypothetical protein